MIVAAWTRLELRRRWRSLAVLALLVAVAAGTVEAAVAGARRGASAYDRLWARSLPATITVLPNQPGFDWAPIRKLPEVAALTTFAVSTFAIDKIPLDEQNVGFPPGDDQVMTAIERPVVLQGRVFNPHRVDEVVVTPLFPARFGKGVGDTVTLDLPSAAEASAGYDPASGKYPTGPKIRARIVGVVRSPWFSDSVGSQGSVIATPALLSRYRASIIGTGGTGYINALVRLRGGAAAIPEFRADLARLTGRSDIDVWSNPVTFGDPIHRVNGYEAACLLAFALAALAAALFLVGSSVARYAAAAVSDLALLRAPGLAPRQAIAAASAAPLLAALLGAAAGTAGAVIASRWTPIGAAALVEPSPGISLDWPVLAGGLVLAPLLVLAAAAASAARSGAATRGARRGWRRSAVTQAVATAGLPVPVLIGTRFAVEPGRGRAALPVRPALLGAVAGVLGVLAALTFSAGVSDAAANPARFGQTFQLGAFYGLNGQDFWPAGKISEAVAASADVTGVIDARMAVAEAGQVSISTYTYAPVAGKRMPVVLTAGRMPSGPGEIVLAPTTARQLGARAGSQISLTGGAGRETVTVTGTGFVPSGPHNDYDVGAWMTPGGYDRVFDGAKYSFKFHLLLISLRPGADPAAVAGQLGDTAASVKGGSGVSFQPPGVPLALLQVRDVAVLPLALGAFLALLALGAIGHALATAVRRRGHELAVLRALGLTRGQARLVTVTQACVLAAVGAGFGIPLGIALGRATWRLVAASTPLAYTPPLAVWALALAGPLALVAANLLAAWPGHRAARLAVARILRAE